MTGDQLINKACREIEELDYESTGPKADHSRDLLNDVLRDLFTRHPFSWRVDPSPISIPTTSQSLYTFGTPTGGQIQDFIAVVLDTGNTQTKPLTEIAIQEFIRKYADVDYVAASYPNEYAKLGPSAFKVAPRASSTSWYLRIFYVPEYQDVSSFGLELPYPNRTMETIKLGLIARLFKNLREYDKATYNYTLFETQIMNLIKEDKNNPNLEFIFRGAATSSSGIYPGEYWKNPFIRRVR